MKLLIFTLSLFFSAVYAGSLPCSCRLGSLNRIVGGQFAADNAIPWIVSLASENQFHFCGGTILNETFILTASHCIEERPENIRVRVGLRNSSVLEENRIYSGKRVIKNNYSLGGSGDFALIELENPIKFVPGEIEPACLNLVDEEIPGDLFSAGWGLTDRPWKDPKNLNDYLHYDSKSSDVLKYYFSHQMPFGCADHNICVISKNEDDSACNGDSGGPLMHTVNGKTSVIGVASYVPGIEFEGKINYCVGLVSYSRLSLDKKSLDEHVSEYCTV